MRIWLALTQRQPNQTIAHRVGAPERERKKRSGQVV